MTWRIPRLLAAIAVASFTVGVVIVVVYREWGGGTVCFAYALFVASLGNLSARAVRRHREAIREMRHWTQSYERISCFEAGAPYLVAEGIPKMAGEMKRVSGQ